MSNRLLYFIPIIASALREKDSRSSLNRAFRRIQEIGESPPYTQGYKQFLRFMNESIQSLSEPYPASRPTIFLTRDGREIGALQLSPTAATRTFLSISPGHYALVLETGWTLWERRLEERHVRWSLAFPGEAFEMAAATEPMDEHASLVEEIHEGALSVRVAPGPESARLIVTTRPFEA